MGNILSINEETEPLFPSGSGASPIAVLGDCGFTADPTKAYFFGSYFAAKKDHTLYGNSIGPEPTDWEDNPALAAVRDIFLEGAVREAGQTIGINQVYVINMGSTPTANNWATAMETLTNLPINNGIELYVGVDDVEVHEQIGLYLDELEEAGDYRNAIVTVTPGSTKEEMIEYTEVAEESDYIHNSRVHIHTDPTMQATYAAKVACTPFYQDPGYGPYRSKNVDNIVVWSTADRDDLKEAGLVVDAPNLINPALAEPYMAVSTAYVKEEGVVPTDSLLHIRRNVDEHWRQTDMITLRMIKMNNTAVAKGLIENVAISYLREQVTKGYLIKKVNVPTDPGYMFELGYDETDPFKLHRIRKVRPVGSVHTIEDISIIQVPIGGG